MEERLVLRVDWSLLLQARLAKKRARLTELKDKRRRDEATAEAVACGPSSATTIPSKPSDTSTADSPSVDFNTDDAKCVSFVHPLLLQPLFRCWCRCASNSDKFGLGSTVVNLIQVFIVAKG
jgi:hypothetical protein